MDFPAEQCGWHLNVPNHQGLVSKLCPNYRNLIDWPPFLRARLMEIGKQVAIHLIKISYPFQARWQQTESNYFGDFSSRSKPIFRTADVKDRKRIDNSPFLVTSMLKRNINCFSKCMMYVGIIKEVFTNWRTILGASCKNTTTIHYRTAQNNTSFPRKLNKGIWLRPISQPILTVQQGSGKKHDVYRLICSARLPSAYEPTSSMCTFSTHFIAYRLIRSYSYQYASWSNSH